MKITAVFCFHWKCLLPGHCSYLSPCEVKGLKNSIICILMCKLLLPNSHITLKTTCMCIDIPISICICGHQSVYIYLNHNKYTNLRQSRNANIKYKKLATNLATNQSTFTFQPDLQYNYFPLCIAFAQCLMRVNKNHTNVFWQQCCPILTWK